MKAAYRHYLTPRSKALAPSHRAIAKLVERLRVDRWLLTTADPAFGAQLEHVFDGAHHRTGGFAKVTIDNPRPGSAPSPRDVTLPIPLPLTADWLDAHRSPHATDPRLSEIALLFPLAIRDGGFAAHGLPYPFTFGEGESTYHAIEVHRTHAFVRHAHATAAPTVCCACGAELEWDPRSADSFPGKRLLAIEGATRIDPECPRCGLAYEPDGALAYRFAIVIDCGKGFPRERSPIVLRREFRAVCEDELGLALDDVGELTPLA